MADKSYYRKKLVDLKLQLTRERDAKKRDNESYARMIRNASSASGKAAYRRSKIERSASHQRNIDRLKEQIARTRLEMSRCR